LGSARKTAREKILQGNYSRLLSTQLYAQLMVQRISDFIAMSTGLATSCRSWFLTCRST